MYKINWSLFGLSHDNWQDFCVSQAYNSNGRDNNLKYIIYRCGVLLYLTIMMLVDLILFYIRSYEGLYYLTFFTNWTYICLMLTSLVQCLTAFSYKDNFSVLPKLSWVLLNISHTNVLFVCVFFWTFAYEPGMIQIGVINTHALVGVYVIIDLLVQKAPRRIHHFYQPAIFGIVYMIFTLIYYYAGGTGREGRVYIYEVLNWECPASASGMIMLAFISIGVFHLVTCVICRARKRLFAATQTRQADTVMA